jgi:N-acetyl-beta-hexosaminidase
MDGRNASYVKRALNAGRTTIISKFSPYYLDYPHAMHPLKSVYEFSPNPGGIREDADIMGVEALLWTEYVEDMARAERLACPRLGAVCETAWSDAGHREYGDFLSRLPVYLRLLDLYHVHYAGLKEANPALIRKIGQMKDFLKRARLFSRANRRNTMETIRFARAMAKTHTDA